MGGGGQMRVLVLTPRPPHRGILSGHQIVYQRIRRLVDRGYRVGVACFKRPDEPDYAEEWGGRLLALRTAPLPPPGGGPATRLARRISGVPSPFSALWSPAMSGLIGDMVEESRYDVVLAEFTAMAQFLRRNPRLPAVRTVVSCHQSATIASLKRSDVLGYSPRGLIERWRRERIQRYESELYRSADRVIVLTPQERHQLLQFAPQVRTAVIPFGVDTDFFRPPEAPVTPDGILFTGYYRDEPNRDAVRWFIAQVWPVVRQRHPNLFFYIVGPNPPPDILNAPWKDPRIIVAGEVGDVRQYLARAAAFVCPVRMGSGMRGKLLEAMASDVPVVSTTLGCEGIPVQPGGNCLLADEAEIMARQIDLLLTDEELRRKIARRARAMVRERFAWDRTVSMLEDVLGDVTGRRRRTAPAGSSAAGG